MIERLTKNTTALALSALGVIVLLAMSVSIVPETSQALITSYGEYKRTVNPYRSKDVLGSTTQAGQTLP